jgi:hypothetical protein
MAVNFKRYEERLKNHIPWDKGSRLTNMNRKRKEGRTKGPT